MIRRENEMVADVRTNMRGGNGDISIINLLTTEEMYDKGRLFANIIINPGCSVGYHEHEGEMEAYYVVRGVGELMDGDKKVILNAGDLAYTPSGSGHSIANCSDEVLQIIALIITT